MARASRSKALRGFKRVGFKKVSYNLKERNCSKVTTYYMNPEELNKYKNTGVRYETNKTR